MQLLPLLGEKAISMQIIIGDQLPSAHLEESSVQSQEKSEKKWKTLYLQVNYEYQPQHAVEHIKI